MSLKYSNYSCSIIVIIGGGRGEDIYEHIVSTKLHSLIMLKVRDDPKLPGDSGEILISKWSGWRFDSHCEIFCSLDGKD